MKKFIISLLVSGLSILAYSENMAIEVHPSGKVGINLPEGIEPSAQIEINGDAKIHGSFNLQAQESFPESPDNGDVVLLTDETIHIYLAGEWRKMLLSVPESNEKPVANAGVDIVVSDSDGTGEETVLLDGSASTDDGQIVSYSWLMDGDEIATGDTPSYNFPNGTHLVTLNVMDNYDVLDADSMIVKVQPVAEGFENNALFSTVPLKPAPALPSGSSGENVGEITFLESTTAIKTKNYHSKYFDRSVVGMNQFIVSFKAGLVNAEAGDLRVRARVWFDNGISIYTSFYTLDANDHSEMETFKVTKDVPEGATAITRLTIQARTQSLDTASQIGYVDDLVIEEPVQYSQF